MLINLSNHKQTQWSEAQLQAAEPYGEIIDLEFPQIDPAKDENYISQLATNYRQKYDVTVHLMGEMNFTFALLQLLQEHHIPCVASTTRRDVVEDGSGQKISTFQFVKFRRYF